MTEKKTSLFENGLIWFGAAVSIAEILTGTYFAPLGFSKGLLAIIIGHLIGCTFLFLSGIIGGKTGRSAMDTVKMSFGNKGSILFALLNVIQLVGWTSIMIFDGAISADSILGIGKPIWCIIIGGLIVLWIAMGIKNLGKLNTVTMMALLVLTIVISVVIFTSGGTQSFTGETVSFGAAVELSVAMPLSWLPLISDYTKDAEKPVKASAVSALVYGAVSCWMYIIGMSATIFTGESDIAQIILKAGIGIVGLIVVVLATVTTTFLDAYSAGLSAESIIRKVNPKWVAIGTAVIGTIGAIFFPMNNITDFLYFIGSVFAPMIAVQLADFFFVKRDNSNKKFDIVNLIIWIIGFVIYRLLMTVDIPVGNTLPDMVITFFLVIAVNKINTVIKRK